ncbi:MAG: hypothetical protein LBH43_17940 [Treponema sp.]|jgi:prolyl oligopeptidase PreP (S9A serine peptidase family)|nr:hypothetical protein [Treponema sp.]
MIGRITADPFVETVKNGEAKALFAQVELQTGDVRTVQIFPGINADLWPCKGDVMVVERAGGLLYAAPVWDGEEPALKPGEREVYSRDSDRKRVTRIFQDKDGNIFIDADEDINMKAKNLNIEIKEHTYIKTKTYHLEVKEQAKVDVGKDFDINVSGSEHINVNGNILEKAGGVNRNDGATVQHK